MNNAGNDQSTKFRADDPGAIWRRRLRVHLAARRPLHGLAACLDHLVFRKIDETRQGGSGGAEEADAFGHAGHARFESIWVQAPNSSLIPTVSIAAQVSSTMCATITRSR